MCARNALMDITWWLPIPALHALVWWDVWTAVTPALAPCALAATTLAQESATPVQPTALLAPQQLPAPLATLNSTFPLQTVCPAKLLSLAASPAAITLYV